MLYHDEVKNMRGKLIARHQAGEFGKCVFIGEKLIRLHRQNKNTRSMSYADDLFNLAIIYEDMGRYQRAVGYYTESLKVLQELSGIGVSFAERLTNLAIAHNKAGEHLTALGIHSKALSILRKRLGQEHPIALESLSNLANCMLDAKMYKNALKTHLQALEILRHRPDSVALADCLNACGYSAEGLEDMEQAEGYFIEALDVIAKSFGTGCEFYVTSLLYLSEFWNRTGKHADAVKGYNKSAALLKKFDPGNRMGHAAALGGAAEAYEKLGDIKKSLSVRLRSLGVMEKSIGGNHLYLANMNKNIAMGYGAMGDSESAIRLLKKTLKIKESIIGRHNESYAKDVLALSYFYAERREYKKVTSTLKQFLKQVDLKDPETPSYYAEMNELCRVTGEIAVKLSKQASPEPIKGKVADNGTGEVSELFRRVSGRLELDLGEERP